MRRHLHHTSRALRRWREERLGDGAAWPARLPIDKLLATRLRPDMAAALDDRDLRMLQILATEGRIAKTELARRVNLSATPCGERLKRLEREGLILGYHAEVALARIAPHITVFVLVELEAHRARSFSTFERHIEGCEAIINAWALGGGFDYLLQVVAVDIDAYQQLMDALLEARIGLERYFTYVVTKSVKAGPPPLALLLGERAGQQAD